MKTIVKGLCCLGLVVGFSSLASAADQTWTGKISDSNCGASHAQMIAEHAGSSGAKMTDAQCTAACVKMGAQYVFVTGGKVYKISNQDFGDLAKDAGRTVSLTGSMSGDTITVSKMTMASKKST